MSRRTSACLAAISTTALYVSATNTAKADFCRRYPTPPGTTWANYETNVTPVIAAIQRDYPGIQPGKATPASMMYIVTHEGDPTACRLIAAGELDEYQSKLATARKMAAKSGSEALPASIQASDGQQCPVLPTQAEIDARGGRDKAAYMIRAIRRAFPGIIPLYPYNYPVEAEYAANHPAEYKGCRYKAALLMYSLGARPSALEAANMPAPMPLASAVPTITVASPEIVPIAAAFPDTPPVQPSGLGLFWETDQPWMKASDPVAVKVRQITDEIGSIRKKIASEQIPKIKAQLDDLKRNYPGIPPANGPTPPDIYNTAKSNMADPDNLRTVIGAQLRGYSNNLRVMQEGMADIVGGQLPGRSNGAYWPYAAPEDRDRLDKLTDAFHFARDNYNMAKDLWDAREAARKKAAADRADKGLPPLPVIPEGATAGWYMVNTLPNNFYPKGMGQGSTQEGLPKGWVLKYIGPANQYMDQFEIVGQLEGAPIPANRMHETGQATRGMMSNLTPEQVDAFNKAYPGQPPIWQTAPPKPAAEPIPEALRDVEEARPFIFANDRNGIPANYKAAVDLSSALGKVISTRRRIAVAAWPVINRRIYELQAQFPGLEATGPLDVTKVYLRTDMPRLQAGAKLGELLEDKKKITDLSSDLRNLDVPDGGMLIMHRPEANDVFNKYASVTDGSELQQASRDYRMLSDAYDVAWKEFRDTHLKEFKETPAQLCPSRFVAMNSIQDMETYDQRVKDRNAAADACEKEAAEAQTSLKMTVTTNGKLSLWALIPLAPLIVAGILMVRGPKRSFRQRLTAVSDVFFWVRLGILYVFATGHAFYVIGLGVFLALSGLLWAPWAWLEIIFLVFGGSGILAGLVMLARLLGAGEQTTKSGPDRQREILAGLTPKPPDDFIIGPDGKIH